jgi:1,4-dihydroxy-2-naphthoate polyprenyltransferase
MSRGRAWFLAIRPRTLPASVTPVIVGTALAAKGGALRLPVALAALLVALLLQIGANLHNDLADFQRGTDREGRVGPVRVTSAGLLSPQAVERATWLVFGLAGLPGLYLVYVGGWPFLLIGATAILAAWAYTGGPFPLGYHGLGDLMVFLFFGLAGVVGTYYLQTRRLDPAAWLAAVAIGALITAILVVNNLRDIDGDRLAGKRTLAVRLGRRGAQVEFVALLLAAYVVPLILWLGLGYQPWVLLVWLSLWLAVSVTRLVLTQTGPILNRALAGTGQLVAVYGLLLSVGVLL